MEARWKFDVGKRFDDSRGLAYLRLTHARIYREPRSQKEKTLCEMHDDDEITIASTLSKLATLDHMERDCGSSVQCYLSSKANCTRSTNLHSIEIEYQSTLELHLKDGAKNSYCHISVVDSSPSGTPPLQ